MNPLLAKQLFHDIKEKRPLIHHITNNVTINDCANATLAIGGSPVMATAIEEVEEMVQLADTLVINFGTIQEEFFEAMIKAGKAANHKGIPVILDPVGVGATSFRTEKAKELLQKIKVTIIRGNVSEIYALNGGKGSTNGVDAGDVPLSAIEIAEQAANDFQCIVGISGKEDVVSDGKSTYLLQNGDQILTSVTGTGCMSTSLIGNFSAITNHYLFACIVGMSVMSLAGERAKQQLSIHQGIGTFKVNLMDEIYLMNEGIFEAGVRIHEV
ncbi:hydroxyethylthiazole kinase [Heyndrickxia sporothermodurans]